MFNTSFTNRGLADLAGLSQAWFPCTVVAQDQHLVGLLQAFAFNDGMDLCMKKDLAGFIGLLGMTGLKGMGLDVGVCSHTQDPTLFIQDQCFDIMPAHPLGASEVKLIKLPLVPFNQLVQDVPIPLQQMWSTIPFDCVVLIGNGTNQSHGLVGKNFVVVHK